MPFMSQFVDNITSILKWCVGRCGSKNNTKGHVFKGD